ncbi:MAG TPA: polyribonucleotide nucleotidyltransferase [Chloroflexota bacterium]|nr:polyribonucleotide nucleotidyltransferase [Chloroflexota bacterium]
MLTKSEATLGGQALTLENGRWAGQAGGSVTVHYGDNVILCTACMASRAREGIDFFPLSVDIEEKSYAAGRIPGSVLRREARPPDSAILAARLTDRPLRPLFPKGMANDVQIINTILATDQDTHTDVLGIVGASAALTISPIPFNGPVGAVRVGIEGDNFVTNPDRTFLEENPSLDLIVVANADGIVMLEAGAIEVADDRIADAIEYGFREAQITIELQHDLQRKVGQDKIEPIIRKYPDELLNLVADRVRDDVRAAVRITDSAEHSACRDSIQASVVEALAGEEHSERDLKSALSDVFKAETRRAILEDGHRPDGRAIDELRDLSADVGVLPRVHGTGLFQRGQTQCLSVATLGSGRQEQRIGLDNFGIQEPKRFLHHYNMPPFASGEAYPLRGPRRREIGHGHLAERALRAVLPSQDDFPYAIRVVSEILSSNGSTSMAATTASSLALMDAGVPLAGAVTGISIGAIIESDDRYAILTDIQGAEDHFGDMDFKVAGTAKGVTAIQLDIKVSHIGMNIVRDTIVRARETRLKILETTNAALGSGRENVGEFAPKVFSHSIDPGKIGEIIGPGGKIIRRMQTETETEIDVTEDGTVTVMGQSLEGAQRAVQMIKDITGDIEIGRVIMGQVVRIMDFGAFVEIAPGRDGLVHISQLAEHHVNRVEDIVSEGDEIMVKIVEVDDRGRINLSRRAVLEEHGVGSSRTDGSGDGGGGDRGGRSDGGGRGRPRGGRDRR